jgi:hypothetical protein
MDGTGSGSCPVAGSGASGAERSGSVTGELAEDCLLVCGSGLIDVCSLPCMWSSSDANLVALHFCNEMESPGRNKARNVVGLNAPGFWNIARRSPCVSRRFGGTYLLVKGRKSAEQETQRVALLRNPYMKRRFGRTYHFQLQDRKSAKEETSPGR